MKKYSLDLLWNGKSFNIEKRYYCAQDSMLQNHQHPHYEIYYQLKGDRYYFIKDRTYYVQEGSIVWLDVFEIHKTLQAHEVEGERILINFNREFIGQIARSYTENLLKGFSQGEKIILLSKEQRKEIESILYKMLNYQKEKFYEQVLLSELLILAHKYKENCEEGTYHKTGTMKYERIAKITEYLNENYRNKITLEGIAKQFYISPYYLSRTFKEGTGFNLINYLNYIRINKAKTLLRETSWSVMVISQEVGFESTTHFDRVFKEVVGISPIKYRKQ